MQAHANVAPHWQLLSVESEGNRKPTARAGGGVKSVADHGHLAIVEYEHAEETQVVDETSARRERGNQGRQ